MNGSDKLLEARASGQDDILSEVEQFEEEIPEFVAPDKGWWGVLVCITSFCCNGTVFGIINTFGILYVEMLKTYKSDQDEKISFKIAMIGSLQIFFTFFLSMIASILTDRFGIRQTAFIGASLSTLGMLLTTFIGKDVYLIYITYGIMVGAGSSLMYTPSLVILGHYYNRNLGLVNGIVSFGSAVYTIILTFFLKWSLANIGLINTYRVLMGLHASMMLGCLTWIPLYQNKHTELDHYLNKSRCDGICLWIKKFINVNIWKNRSYVLWVIAIPISFLGYFVPFVHLIKYAKMAMPGENVELLMIFLCVTSGFSRLLCGKLADHPKLNRIYLQQFALFTLGVCTLGIPFAYNIWGLGVITFLMGFADGSFICLVGPIAFDLLGPSGAAQGIGMLLGINSIPMSIGPVVAGYIYDLTSNYKLCFWLAGCPPIIAAFILCFLSRNQKKVRRNAKLSKPPQQVTFSANRAVSIAGAYKAMSTMNLDTIDENTLTVPGAPVYTRSLQALNFLGSRRELDIMTRSSPGVQYAKMDS